LPEERFEHGFERCLFVPGEDAQRNPRRSPAIQQILIQSLSYRLLHPANNA
jgi:hypothetical protein